MKISVVKLNEALGELKNTQITRIMPNQNFLNLTFSNGTTISTAAYAYRTKMNGSYDTLAVYRLIQKEFALYETETLELTPKIEEALSVNFDKREEEKKNSQVVGEELQKIFESYQSCLSIKEVHCTSSNSFRVTFKEVEDFYIELYASSIPTYQIRIETEKYTFIVDDKECYISQEKVEKDYKSFSSAAKSRFRTMAKELGYEQITGITYVKEREGWYETFNLQSSSYGNPFFYLNYGVILPDRFPMTREELRDSGWNLGGRISPEGSGAFNSGNRKQIEESASLALELYREKVVPWFASLTLEKIEKEIAR